jgi:sortase A
VHPGDLLGKIEIPRIGLDFYYVAGVSVAELGRGVGHIPNTPLPGQLGNAALAGHRTSHLAPFSHLDELKAGDEVQIFTAIGGAYVYTVTESFVVGPSDYHVVTDSDPAVGTLTLITCHPRYTSERRLVVRATLDTERSSPIGAALTEYRPSEPTGTTLPPEDTTVPTTAAPETTSAAATTTVQTTTGPSTTVTEPAAATTQPAAPPTTSAPGENSPFDVDDAFSNGWFDDAAAWPHLLGWSAALVAIVCGAWRLARRRRSLLIGGAVAAAPFLVALYFFYENLNRLLPAAI